MVLAGAVGVFCGLVALGTWQIQRRTWKLDLIARVDARVHAPATAAPPASAPISAARDEYRHVAATGTFLPEDETLVQAVTELGAGYWVLMPLRLSDGTDVLVNRGFVAQEMRDPAAHAAGLTPGPSTVTGLLRMTEPGGAFLRHNDPTANRWYSRDVQAIAAARHLKPVAPYFIDADADAAAGPAAPAAPAAPTAPPPPAIPASGEPVTAPIGGLTVITFHNNHLVYAITWYTLALMTLAAVWRGLRDERREGRPDPR